MSKKLKVRPLKGLGTLYEIYYEGGGQVPNSLSGHYTRKDKAEYAIANYVPPKPNKSKKVSEDEPKEGRSSDK